MLHRDSPFRLSLASHGRVAWTELEHFARLAAWFLVHVGTLPYYRFFHYNNLAVFMHLAEHGQRPEQIAHAILVLSQWREKKLQELQFVSVACIAIAGAVIGSFSWSFLDKGVWLTFALWYNSLVLSVLGILLAAQQSSAIGCLGPIPETATAMDASDVVRRYLKLMLSTKKRDKPSGPSMLTHSHALAGTHRPSWRMMFVWQCPLMLMSYSVCSFLLGLTVLVITPLTRVRDTGWNNDCSVAIFYLTVGCASSLVFVLCSFWIYEDIEEYVQLPIVPSNSAGGNFASV